MYQAAANPNDSARLEDYIRAVRLHKLVVVGLALACAALAFYVASSRAATYTAASSILLSPSPVGSTADNRLVTPNLEKEREILLSNRSAVNAAALIGFDGDPGVLLSDLDVAFRPDTDVLTVAYTSGDPDTAAEVANGFSAAFAAQRDAEAEAIYVGAIETSQTQLDAINAELLQLGLDLDALLVARQGIITDELPGPERDNSITNLDASANEIRADISSLGSGARAFENELRANQSTVANRRPSAEVLRLAVPPSTPNGLSTNIYTVGGLLLGLILGIVTAFLMDRLDTTARDDDDVALALGTRVIGSLPMLGLSNRSGASALVMLTKGGNTRLASSREAFRRLRSSVQFLNSNSNVRTIVITSASPSEGKSVTSANLAISLAQSGSRVALVSADMRRPTQEELFGVQLDGEGLSGYLGKGSELGAIQVPDIPNLWLVHSGASPSNPGELLGSARFQSLVEELEAEVDFAIIDTPPILSTADALAAARYVDGVLIVVDTRRTETTELLQVRSDLERSGATVLGAVMNRRRIKRGGLFNRRKFAYYRSDKTNGSQSDA